MIRYILALSLAAMASTADAQEAPPCGRMGAMHSMLADRYGEQMQGLGLTGVGTVAEVWANADTGTWTIVISRPDGVSCIAASGLAWESVPPAPGGVEG